MAVSTCGILQTILSHLRSVFDLSTCQTLAEHLNPKMLMKCAVNLCSIKASVLCLGYFYISIGVTVSVSLRSINRIYEHFMTFMPVFLTTSGGEVMTRRVSGHFMRLI